MADLLYSGGPCSGRHVSVPDDSLADGRIMCGGLNYRAYEVSQGEWLALPPSAPAPHTVTASARKAGPAWQHLVHGLVSQLPADARRSARARQHLLRIARR